MDFDGVEGSEAAFDTSGSTAAGDDGIVDAGEECDDGNTIDDDECSNDCRVPDYDVGTGTPGWWKNRGWRLGWPPGVDFFNGCPGFDYGEAREWLQTPVSGDKTYTMAYHLVAAKLNVANGTNPTCIAPTIAAAEAWICDNPVGSEVHASSDEWSTGGPMATMLDEYNNGYLCAPHRDD